MNSINISILIGLLFFISIKISSTSIRYCNIDNQTPLIVYHIGTDGNLTMTPVPPNTVFRCNSKMGYFICNKELCGYPYDSMFCTQDNCHSSCQMSFLEGRENVYITVGHFGNGVTSFVAPYPLNIYNDHCLSPNFLQFVKQTQQQYSIQR